MNGEKRRLSDDDRARIEAIIVRNSERVESMRGFLAAEPGFPLIGGRLERRPAIIVYVDRKLPRASLLDDEMAPSEIEGVPVDVVQADPWKQLELARPPAAERGSPFEAAPAAIGYEGIDGDPIDSVYEVEGPILCHAGPDAGWTVLRDYLGATETSLTVAMYDFSADYVAKTVIETAEAKGVGIDLTIDDSLRGDESEIQSRLQDRLGAAYRAAIVYCGGSRRFPSAYHPKVAVQDGRRFWISSGNWSPRSQPPIDPLGTEADRRSMYSRGNREWHLIVEDRPLAALFERYIKHDKASAESDGKPATRALEAFPDLFVSLDGLVDMSREAFSSPAPPVAPASLPTRPRRIEVRPLLSPDNYARRIEEWIRGAGRSLYLQYSYINYSRAAQDGGFRAVLDHLAERSWDESFDLRIIVGSNSADKVRILAENGFKESAIRVQSNIHNKGIVRDGASVLVSSQNWSGDGFLRNRDAGLIISDAEIAGYFEAIFLADWERRARDAFAAPAPETIIAPRGARPPAGMVRMSWAEYFGE